MIIRVFALMVLFSSIVAYGQEYDRYAVDSSLNWASNISANQPEEANKIIDEQLVIINSQLTEAKLKDNNQVVFHQYTRAKILKGIIYKNSQLYYDAYQSYAEALKMAAEIDDDRLMMILHNNIAVIYNEIGDNDLRNKYFEQSINFSKKINDYKLERDLSYNQALFYIEDGDTEAGFEIYAPIYEKAMQQKDSLYIAAFWTLQARQQIVDSNDHEAIHSCIQALNYSQNFPENYFSITSQIDLATLYFKQGQINKADSLVSRNLKLMSDAQEYSLYLEAIKLQADIYEAKGEYKQSNLLHNKYNSISDSLGVEQNKQEALKKGFLDDFNERQRLDSIKYTNEQVNILNESQDKISKFNLFWMITLLLILLILLVVWVKYRKNKKSSRRYIHLLKEEVQLLKNNHLKLEERLKKMSSSRSSTKKNSVSSEKYLHSSLTDLESESILDQLLDYMKNSSPYLNPTYSLKDLSKETKIPSHHISEVLNNSLGQNFYTFFNIYRVEEAKKLMSDNVNGELKLLAICYDSGFNSKATFNRVFKAVTETTPSAFQKQYLKK